MAKAKTSRRRRRVRRAVRKAVVRRAQSKVGKARTRRTKNGTHTFKPHPKGRKGQKCPHCAKAHSASEHWSHKANTGKKSYKRSRKRK